ncbi:MAG TPA: CHC2 zinc finger domain-containing protein, partial [Pyrinomonadaceae bacterium]
MRFPQTFIDDLRRQSDIVRIVQDYVTLKKAGANWVARCPFHKETKPSFSVNPAKEIFYCFGCQKGGSVFNFVM